MNDNLESALDGAATVLNDGPHGILDGTNIETDDEVTFVKIKGMMLKHNQFVGVRTSPWVIVWQSGLVTFAADRKASQWIITPVKP